MKLDQKGYNGGGKLDRLAKRDLRIEPRWPVDRGSPLDENLPVMPNEVLQHWLRPSASLIFLFLAIEFLDEFVFGAGEAAWPLIRDDLGLTYIQIGVLLSLPKLVSNLVEPILGILADTWRRQAIILAGGMCFAAALFLTAMSWGLAAPFFFYRFWACFWSVCQFITGDPDGFATPS